jgi:hypothetical protein
MKTISCGVAMQSRLGQAVLQGKYQESYAPAAVKVAIESQPLQIARGHELRLTLA